MLTFTLFLSLWARILLPALHPAAEVVKPALLPDATVVSSEKSYNEYLTWSPERRLSWDDFKALPDNANPHHALTAANLAVNARCKDNNYTYEVNCVFLPEQSWSKNKKSEKLLAHEQLHFDLTEVHARQLRRDLQRLNCSSLKANLNTVVQNAFRNWKAEQDAFDKACAHGLDKEKQQAWAQDIDLRLKELQAYR